MNVLREARTLRLGSGATWETPRLRREAVQVVAARELSEQRFANETSARNSIQDACCRRLNLEAISDFDAALEQFLADEPAPMERLLAALTARQTAEIPTAIDIEDAELPERRQTLVERIIRDTATARDLKKKHRDRCQICGLALEMAKGCTYSEAHHIRPLGAPHNGPDTVGNILVLCPNHHALCDFRAIRLDMVSLHRVPGHIIDESHVEYHNSLCTAV